MFSFLTDNVSKYAGIARHALGIIGGAAVSFAVVSQDQVTSVLTNYDAIVQAVLSIATSASGIVGSVAAIGAIVASVKAKKAAVK